MDEIEPGAAYVPPPATPNTGDVLGLNRGFKMGDAAPGYMPKLGTTCPNRFCGMGELRLTTVEVAVNDVDVCRGLFPTKLAPLWRYASGGRPMVGSLDGSPVG